MSAGAPPYEATAPPSGWGQAGDRPPQQRGGSHLRNDPAAGAGGQEGHQPGLGDPKTTKGDRQDSHQPAPQQLQGDFHPRDVLVDH